MTIRNIFFCFFVICLVSCSEEGLHKVTVSSLEELAEYAGKDSVEVVMEEGTYRFSDSSMGKQLTLQKISGDKVSDYDVAALIDFSGRGSVYHLEGVVIEIEGKMHRAYPKRHLFEIFVSGNGNVISGLKVRDIDNVIPVQGAIMMHVSGDGNIIRNADLYIEGSSPYGYGHLLGKGGGAMVKLYKHSSLLVTGKDNVLDGCHVETHAFGHGIVMQGAVNTTIRNCYVKGCMRPTDEMLAETSGPAYENGFISDYPPGRIVPGEMKALSEDGVRAYPSGYNGRKTENLKVENTVVENMRSGFDFSAMRGSVEVIGCTAIGCQEKGYSLPSGGRITACRGDAMYGPLLTFITKDIANCDVELELLPGSSDYKVERLAEIQGRGHKIVLKRSGHGEFNQNLPVVFGESFWADVHKFREPDADIRTWSGAECIDLTNQTGMPVILTEYSSECRVRTNGVVTDNGNMNVIN